MAGRSTVLVPGTLFLDGIKNVESGETKNYTMAVYSPQIDSTIDTFQILSLAVSSRSDWISCTVPNDCSFTLNIAGTLISNVKILPQNKIINFNAESSTNHIFKRNGLYLITVTRSVTDLEASILPLSILGDVYYDGNKYIIPGDVQVEGSSLTLNAISSMVENMHSTTGAYVAIDEYGNATLDGIFYGKDFIANGVSFANIITTVTNAMQALNAHLADYQQLLDTVSQHSNSLITITNDLNNTVKLNTDGSVSVTDVKYSDADGHEVSMSQNIAIALTAVQSIANVETRVASLETTSANHTTSISEVNDALQTANSLISSIQAEITDMKKNGLGGTPGSEDFKDNVISIIEGSDITTTDVVISDYIMKQYSIGRSIVSGNPETWTLQTSNASSSKLSELLTILSNMSKEAFDRIIDLRDELNSVISDVKSLQTSLTTLQTEFNSHVNSNVHLTTTQRNALNQWASSDLMLVFTDTIT